MASPPQVLVSASAIGYYGDRGEQVLDETSDGGQGFLAEVATEWEGATQPVEDVGVRVVRARFGIILSRDGGALARMLTPAKLGMAGRIGSGRQYWSWVSLEDTIGALCHALTDGSISGPVNIVSPNPVTNAEFMATLGQILRRPACVPLPAFAARWVLGEMAEPLLLASTRVTPLRLEHAGYSFRHETLASALRDILAK
jgi:uncharacterized protein (TIGR01777 family)